MEPNTSQVYNTIQAAAAALNITDPINPETTTVVAQKPAEHLNHVINTEWYVKGMTYAEFIELHIGAHFDFAELEKQFLNICEDHASAIHKDKPMMCIFFFVGKSCTRLGRKAGKSREA